ncbi:hypothetical protein LSTR_LSTR011810 [Laodelphax striatellus]|uniref:Uncharacterized protein n=1 Tax=Laodelphax striatellus TaxID=195883 RepID=A0A482XU36_LAOST|nr:hypothetical protein LSTR_LSTR011810 [Laodelphax striatellus]
MPLVSSQPSKINYAETSSQVKTQDNFFQEPNTSGEFDDVNDRKLNTGGISTWFGTENFNKTSSIVPKTLVTVKTESRNSSEVVETKLHGVPTPTHSSQYSASSVKQFSNVGHPHTDKLESFSDDFMTSQFGAQKNVERLEKMRTRPYFNEGAFERSAAYRSSSGKQEMEKEQQGVAASTNQQYYTSQYYQPRTAEVHMVQVSDVEHDKLQKEMMRKLEEMMENMRADKSAKMTSLTNNGDVKEFSHSYFEKSQNQRADTSGVDCDNNGREEIDKMFDLQNRRGQYTQEDDFYKLGAGTVQPKVQTIRKTSHSVSTEEKKETYGPVHFDHSSYSHVQKRHVVDENRNKKSFESGTLDHNRTENEKMQSEKTKNFGEIEDERFEEGTLSLVKGAENEMIQSEKAKNVGEIKDERSEEETLFKGTENEKIQSEKAKNIEEIEDERSEEGTPTTREESERNQSNETEEITTVKPNTNEDTAMVDETNHDQTIGSTKIRSKRSFLPGDYYPSLYEPPESFDDFYRKQLRKGLIDRESNEIPFDNNQEVMSSFLSEPVESQQQTTDLDFYGVNNEQKDVTTKEQDYNNIYNVQGSDFDSDGRRNLETDVNQDKVAYSEIQQLVKSFIEGLEVLSQNNNQGEEALPISGKEDNFDVSNLYQQRSSKNEKEVIDYSSLEQRTGNDYYDKYANLLNQATKDLYHVIFEEKKSTSVKSHDQDVENQYQTESNDDLDVKVAFILAQVSDEMKKIVENERKKSNLYGDNQSKLELSQGGEKKYENFHGSQSNPRHNFGDSENQNEFKPVIRNQQSVEREYLEESHNPYNNPEFESFFNHLHNLEQNSKSPNYAILPGIYVLAPGSSFWDQYRTSIKEQTNKNNENSNNFNRETLNGEDIYGNQQINFPNNGDQETQEIFVNPIDNSYNSQVAQDPSQSRSSSSRINSKFNKNFWDTQNHQQTETDEIARQLNLPTEFVEAAQKNSPDLFSESTTKPNDEELKYDELLESMVELAKTYESLPRTEDVPPHEPIITKSYVTNLGGEPFLDEKPETESKFDVSNLDQNPASSRLEAVEHSEVDSTGKNLESEIIETPIALQQEAADNTDKKVESEIVEPQITSSSFWGKIRNKLKKSISSTKGKISEVSDSITSKVQQTVPELESL